MTTNIELDRYSRFCEQNMAYRLRQNELMMTKTKMELMKKIQERDNTKFAKVRKIEHLKNAQQIKLLQQSSLKESFLQKSIKYLRKFFK